MLCATQSFAGTPRDLVKTFAYCAGRYSAEMEHAWLINDTRADDIALRRQAIVDLLEAVIPVGQGRTVLSYRIDAKLAHAELLQVGTFHTDQSRAKRAIALAQTRIASCSNLLLG